MAPEEPLLFASGGDERDLSLARMVSRRPVSGYWEYHIEGALFTAPVRTDHSGAGLFNADGELFTLLGPSGCGKTTTLNLIGGFETASRGTLLIDGQPMGDTPSHARPVNTVFQSYALFPHLTVADNVAFGLQRLPRPARRDRPSRAPGREAQGPAERPGSGRRLHVQRDGLRGGQRHPPERARPAEQAALRGLGVRPAHRGSERYRWCSRI